MIDVQTRKIVERKYHDQDVQKKKKKLVKTGHSTLGLSAESMFTMWNNLLNMVQIICRLTVVSSLVFWREQFGFGGFFSEKCMLFAKCLIVFTYSKFMDFHIPDLQGFLFFSEVEMRSDVCRI